MKSVSRESTYECAYIIDISPLVVTSLFIHRIMAVCGRRWNIYKLFLCARWGQSFHSLKTSALSLFVESMRKSVSIDLNHVTILSDHNVAATLMGTFNNSYCEALIPKQWMDGSNKRSRLSSGCSPVIALPWHARHNERDQRVEPSSAHRKNSGLKPTRVVNMLAVFGVTLSTNVRH